MCGDTVKKKDLSQENLCFICRLGLERCRQNLAHLQALIHINGVNEGEAVVAGAIAAIVASIDRDLIASADALEGLITA